MGLNPLGVHLTILMGETIPRPISPFLGENLQSAQVDLTDEGLSGFQLTFHAGRASIEDIIEYRLLKDPLLKPFTRVMLVVRFAIAPQVLMDGVITNVALSPSNEPGGSTITVTGVDVSVMMDLEEKPHNFVARSDHLQVVEIVGSYLKYGLVPPPPPLDRHANMPPNPLDDMPQQPGAMTDRAYIQDLASRYGFVFYVTAGPAPGVNTVHWGPPERLTIPQGVLSMGLGPNSNVDSINFQNDGLRPENTEYVDGEEVSRVDSASLSRRIPLARSDVEVRRLRRLVAAGPNAEAQAQAQADRSRDSAVTANGELDASRFGALLKPRTLVSVRGVGQNNDGTYYVKTVTHRISRGSYKQSFSLERNGTGALLPFVLPSV